MDFVDLYKNHFILYNITQATTEGCPVVRLVGVFAGYKRILFQI